MLNHTHKLYRHRQVIILKFACSFFLILTVCPDSEYVLWLNSCLTVERGILNLCIRGSNLKWCIRGSNLKLLLLPGTLFQQPHLLQFDQFLFFRRLLHRRIFLQVLLQSLQLGHRAILDQLPVGLLLFLFLLLWFLWFLLLLDFFHPSSFGLSIYLFWLDFFYPSSFGLSIYLFCHVLLPKLLLLQLILLILELFIAAIVFFYGQIQPRYDDEIDEQEPAEDDADGLPWWTLVNNGFI